MADTGRIRSTSGWLLTIAAAVTALIALTGMTLDGGWQSLLNLGAVPILFAGIVWATFGHPYVRVSDEHVEVCNIFRTVQVSWQTVEDVELRWGLRLVTAFGNYSAWSVPRPSGPKLSGRTGVGLAPTTAPAPTQSRPAGDQPGGPQTGTNRATQAVLDRWQSPKHADSDQAVPTESNKPVTQWNRTQLIVVAILILLSAAGILRYQLG